MKKPTLLWTIWMLAAVTGLTLSACMTSSEETDETLDGDNVVFVQEAKTMAHLLDDSVTGEAPDTLDPATLERIVLPLRYDTACGCFVRSREFTNTNKGFGRSRVDSIWLYAAGEPIVDSFLPKEADSIIHVRHVKRVDGYSGKDVDFIARTTLTREETDSGTVYVWTGTIDGVFKGRELAGGTFTLTRSFSLSNGFGKPQGSVFVKRGPHDLVYMLNEDGTTRCTVYRGGKVVRTEHRDADDNET